MSEEVAVSKEAPVSKRRARLVLFTITAILFLTFLDTTIMSVAAVNLQETLQTSVSDLQWIINAYALLFAALMLAFGTLGDRVGRKKVMLGGLAVFAAGSLFGALAQSIPQLIAARGHHGRRRRCLRAGHALGHQADLSRPQVSGPRRGLVGGHGRSGVGHGSGHRWHPGGHRRLAGDLLVQPGRLCGRDGGRDPAA